MKSKSICKRILACVLSAFALISAAALPGCRRAQPEQEAPLATEVPQVTYTMTHIIRYWPEDADYDSCDYACTVQIPEFSKDFTYGSAMNNAVDAYLEDLSSRIEKKYMPASVAKPPYTEVGCSVEYVGNITNVIFTEQHCYEAQPIVSTYVLMLNERGKQINLCDVFLNYHTQELIASCIAKAIEGDPRFFEADADKVFALLDITHGARSQEGGATVYIPEGLIAPLDDGEIAFDVRYEDICPEFVGEGKAISLDDYRRLTQFLSLVSNSVIVRSENIVSGELSQFAASAFMGELAQSLGIMPQAGRIVIREDRFLDIYRGCFGTEFPGVDKDGFDIETADGSLRVLYKQKEYRHNVDMLDARWDGDTLVVTGDMIFGEFGYAFSAFVCHVEIKLVRNDSAQFGFTLKDMTLSL
ncbi:MAG: hypothetical protein IJM18_08025 [Clostridia bacterium]|nr:hypothetical protein [Clostridia bacterium]